MSQSRRQMGRFYTPEPIAGDLIGMAEITPERVLDLGCGDGALSRAAAARWGGDLRLTTIDVDPDAGPTCSPWTSEHQHRSCDLMTIDPSANFILRGSFDLAVLNPPYGRKRVEQSGLARSRPRTICRPTHFIEHALRAVRIGGLVAAILPETLAVGVASRSSRRALHTRGQIERIAVLPAKSFTGTEARTVMVIFRRVAEREGVADPWWGGSTDASASAAVDQTSATIAELGVEVVRGRLNTAEARKAGAFHLDTFNAATDGVICLPSETIDHDERYACAGDILVARIGRNIADKVAFVEAGSNAISDCIFRLRCPPPIADRVWRGLRSDVGRRQMESSLSGVTTRLLPMRNLLAVQV